MPTILDTLKKGTEYLEKYQIDEARLNMEHLIAHTLKVERMQLYLDFDRPLIEKELETLRGLTKRRSQGEPLQHLLGTVEFCSLEFKTDSRALIPRPETEELADILVKRTWKSPLQALDMGCGSGVLGLTLARQIEGSALTLSDVSPTALELTRENAEELDLTDKVALLESDLFSKIEGRFDLIVANLPYIPNREQTELSKEVQRDPALALYGGEIGTEIMANFLTDAPSFLNDGGMIALEHGIDQAESLRELAEEAGFVEVVTKKDINGIERFLFATKSA